MSSSATADSGSAMSGNFFIPRTWWQWVLVYPALATTVLNGVGPLVDKTSAMVQRVPYHVVNEGQKQNDLWAKYGSCIYENPRTLLVNKNGVEVDAAICDADVIALKRNVGGAIDVRFVSWGRADQVAQASRSSLLDLLPVQAAHAQVAPRPPGDPKLICQRKIDPQTLLTRLKFPSGCVDEKINTFTGQVVSRQNASCSPTC